MSHAAVLQTSAENRQSYISLFIAPSTIKARPGMTLSFARENSVYPFTHAVVNLAFYQCVRDWRWSVIAMYAWESAEHALSSALSELAETCNDSLLGDPTIGILVITAFWLYDQATGADAAFVRQAHPAARLAVFLLVGGTSFLAPLLETTTAYWGIAVYIAIYLAVVVGWFWHLRGSAGRSVLLWLLAATIYALVSLPVLADGPLIASSWMRAFVVSCIFLLAAGIGYLAAGQPRTH